MSETTETPGKLIRVLLAAAVVWLVLAIFPLARDVTLIKVVGFQALVLVAALLAWRKGAAGDGLRLHAPLTLAVLILAAALLLATPFSTNPGHALMELARLVPGIAAFFLAMHVIRNPAHLMPLAAAAVLALTLASIYGLLQWFGYDPFPWGAVTSQDLDLLRRAPATYGNPNLAAHAIILGIPLALMLTATGRWWFLLCLPVLLTHLVVNGTRGAFAGLAVAAVLVVAVWGLGRIRSLPRSAVCTGGLAIPVLVAVLAGAAVLGWTHLRTGTPFPSDPTLTLRFHAMHGAAQMIHDRPVAGHGPGHYIIENAPYWTELEQARYAEIGRRNARVHNEPLELAVQGGLAAGAAYLALLLMVIVQGLWLAAGAADPVQRRIGLGFAAVFTAFAVDSLFGFNLHAPVSGGLFWLLLGAFAGLHAESFLAAKGRLPVRAWAGVSAVSAVALVLGAMAMGASAFALRGDGARTHGEPEAALAQYEIARRLHPWDWRIQQALGGLMLDQTYFATAARHYEESLALHPLDPFSLIGLGRAQAYQAAALDAEGMEGVAHAERASLDAAERAAALCPPMADAAQVRALVLVSRAARALGTPDAPAAAAAAQEAAEALLALAPTSRRQAWQFLANARAVAGDLEGTAEAFAMVLAWAPPDERTWQALDAFAHGTGQYEPYLDSVRWREERLRLEQPDATAERVAMAMRRAEGIASGYDAPAQVSVAFADAARLEPLRPGLWPAFHAFAHHEGQMAAFRRAAAAAGDALEGDESPEALPVRIAGLAAQGAVASAAENCYQALAFSLQRDPLAEVRETYGWVWGFLHGEAERLPEDDETTALVLLRLGMAAALMGEDARALTVLEAAVPRLPREPRIECLRQIGSAAMRLGEHARALEALAQATRIAPEHLGARVDQARALAASGARQAARQAYARILAEFQFDAENRARIEAEMAQVGG